MFVHARLVLCFMVRERTGERRGVKDVRRKKQGIGGDGTAKE